MSSPAKTAAVPRRLLVRGRVALWQGLMILLSLLFLVPLFAMISGSLRQVGLPPPRGIEWLPQPITFANYPMVFQLVEYGRYALNSMVVVILAIPVTLLVGSWAGFALAQLPDKAARNVIMLALLMLLVPDMSLWISRFIIYKLLHLLDTPFALAAPSLLATSPLYMLTFYWTFRRIPKATWEAAQLDGAGAFRAWWSIGVPAARSAMAVVAVLAFVYYWREFREPLLYIATPINYTLSVGLNVLEQLDRTNWSILLAGSVIVTAPLVIVFFLSQPFFSDALDSVSERQKREDRRRT